MKSKIALSKYSDLDRLFGLRFEYLTGKLDDADLNGNPFQQFAHWLTQAVSKKAAKPTAMTLATCSKQCLPSARMMLLKGFNENGFVFYTNYESHKGHDLESNPRAALVFYWGELERQVRIEGRIQKINRKQSEQYFRSRPRNAQLGAWVARQSRSVASRKILEREWAAVAERFEGKAVPLPPYWGGYRLVPSAFEFWQGRENRLNDRFRYEKAKREWRIRRLYP